MAQAAFGRAMVAAGGTMLVIGAGTAGLSAIGLTVTKLVVEKHKKKHLVSCRCCSGKAKVACDVCQGERTLRYHPGSQPPAHPRGSICVCSICEGTGEQTCLNCLGEGKVMPLAYGLQDTINWVDGSVPAISSSSIEPTISASSS